MKRFVIQENIKLFRKFLAEEQDPVARKTVEALLAEAQRNLSTLAPPPRGSLIDTVSGIEGRPQFDRDARQIARFMDQIENSPRLQMIIDPRPGLHIIGVNAAYAKATMTVAHRIAAQRLFDVFPDNPDWTDADGVSSLSASLHTAGQSGRARVMPVQRYDVRDQVGRFVERYWQATNSPVFSNDGRLLYIVHQVEDVTAGMLAAREAERRVEAKPFRAPEVQAMRQSAERMFWGWTRARQDGAPSFAV